MIDMAGAFNPGTRRSLRIWGAISRSFGITARIWQNDHYICSCLEAKLRNNCAI